MSESALYQAMWKLYQQTGKWLANYDNTRAANNTQTIDSILTIADEIRNMQKPGNRKKGKK